ncbi:MAG: long-chain acyl-CoA synthetase [Gammaproteobacteria bacterium]|jgi:long-chain acyl-CoA synthetase
MENFWLNRYPKGVPETLELDPAETLIDVFEKSCHDYGVRPAYSSFGKTISFAELNIFSARFAAYLQNNLGLEKGDKVAIMMPNTLQYPIALFGILRAGMVVVNVNPLYTHRELHHQLKDSEAKAIVIVANSCKVLEEALAAGDTQIQSTIVTEIGDMLDWPKRPLINFAVRYLKRMVPSYKLTFPMAFRDTVKSDAKVFQRPREMHGNDLAFLQYTGGTTGVSKGAMLTHGNMVANLRQVNAWFSNVNIKGEEIMVTPLPLYHVYALTCNCLAYLENGGLNVLITDPRDTKALIAEMKRWQFTAITGVNTLYQSLVNHPALKSVDFSTVKIVSAGGMAVMEPTARAWIEITGTNILEGYGLTEASPVVTTNLARNQGYTGSIGLPLPNTEISLLDDAGVEVERGEPGELCVRGPQVMLGYWQRPDATAESFTADGFLKTGDIAVVTVNGDFKIVDRKKDMILVSGFNVFPSEIEQVLTAHPAIAEAACIGLPNERGGEVVAAYVVINAGSQLTKTDLLQYCRDELTAYKVPKIIKFCTDLPKSNVGKVLRRELRDSELAAAKNNG